MSLRIIKRNPSGEDKEVILEIDPIQSSPGGQTYSVKGKVTDSQGTGLSGKTVILFDSKTETDTDWGEEVPLGFATTNTSGDYLIYYNSTQLGGKIFGDLQVWVYNTDPIGEPEHQFPDLLEDPLPTPDAKSALYLDALANDTINVVFATVFTGKSAYTKFIEKIGAYEPASGFAVLTSKGMEIVATKAGVTVKEIRRYIDTLKLSQLLTINRFDGRGKFVAVTESSPEIPLYDLTEVVYGLVGAGLPVSVIEFLSVSDAEKDKAFKYAIERNIINQALNDQNSEGDYIYRTTIIQDLSVKKKVSILSKVSLDVDTTLEAFNSFGDLLDHTGLTITKCEDFYAFYQENLTNRPLGYNFWDEVVSESVLTMAEATEVKKIYQLFTLTSRNVLLSKSLYTDLAGNTPPDNKVEFLSSYDFADWQGEVEENGSSSTPPESIAEPEISIEANRLLTAFQTAFPEKTLAVNTSGDLQTFLNNNLNLAQEARFDFYKSPTQFFSENPTILDGLDAAAVKTSIYNLKRLYLLIEEPNVLDKANDLLSIGINSASKVVRMGQPAFIKVATSDPVNFSSDEATRTFQRATKQVSAALAIQSFASESLNQTNPAVLPSRPDVNAAVPDSGESPPTYIEKYPQLAVLFGSQSHCHCKDCQSSQSPSAYLVDLLEFVQSAKNVKSGDPAWTQLKARRPEFETLRTSCENTNTVIPYIDLVIEVLEYAVGTNEEVEDLSIIYLDRQTTADAATLRVNPQHQLVAVYDVLKDHNTLGELNSYPWTLPFNLWNEEPAAYLNLLNAKRSEFIRAHRGEGNTNSAISLDEALVQLDIPSGLANGTTDYSVTNPDGTATPYTVFYGGKNASDLKNLQVLIDNSPLSYDEIAITLHSTFLNPQGYEIKFLDEELDEIDSCDLSKGWITDDGTNYWILDNYKNLHMFYRFQRFLGWSFKDLDFVISSSSLGAEAFDSGFFILAAGLKQLSERFGLTIGEVARWYAPLSLTEYAGDPSDFDTVFLNSKLQLTQAVKDEFIACKVGGTPVKIPLIVSNSLVSSGAVAAVLAALRIKPPTLETIVKNEVTNASGSYSVDSTDLSRIYTIVNFAKSLRISIGDYYQLQALYGETIGTNPNNTLAFLHSYDLLSSFELDVPELQYLFTPVIYVTSEEAQELAGHLKKIRSIAQDVLSRNRIDARTVWTEPEEALAIKRERLISFFEMVLPQDLALRSLEVVEAGNNDDTAFISTHWAELASDITVANQMLVETVHEDYLDPSTELEDRLDVALSQFYDSIVSENDLATVLTQAIADELDMSHDVVSVLINEHILNSEDESIFVQLTNSTFLFPNSEDPILSVGSAVLESDYEEIIVSFGRLKKALLVADKLQLSSSDLTFVLDNRENADWFSICDFESITITTIDESFIRLLRTQQLNLQYVSPSFSIFQVIANTIADEPDETARLATLALGTGWAPADIAFLRGVDAFSGAPAKFIEAADDDSEVWLLKIASVLDLSGKLGCSAEQLFGWTSQDLTKSASSEIVSLVKGNFNQDSWQKVATEARDKLRQKQRDTLVSYLLTLPEFTDTNDLYAHFLLDVEMAPCFLTSRIKHAISGVQQWVQRITLNLEDNLGFGPEDLAEWKWRKNYRVWEAGRKVFLYPENWIEPELRDDKTPFFREMEDTLLQDEVDELTAENAYRGYLKKLDEVSHLEIAGLYNDTTSNVLHVFARTKNIPHSYYHRKWENEVEWTGWEAMDLDIESNHLVPVIYNNRPMVFWPVANKTVDPINDPTSKIVPKEKLEIQLAHSEFSNGKWQPKKISKQKIVHTETNLSSYFFHTDIQDGELFIDVYFENEVTKSRAAIGNFFLNSCTGELQVEEGNQHGSSPTIEVIGTIRNGMKFQSTASLSSFEIIEGYQDVNATELNGRNLSVFETLSQVVKQNLLDQIDSGYSIIYPVNERTALSGGPFVYEDAYRTFLINPSDITFTGSQLIDLPGTVITQSGYVIRSTPTIADLKTRIKFLVLGYSHLSWFERELSPDFNQLLSSEITNNEFLNGLGSTPRPTQNTETAAQLYVSSIEAQISFIANALIRDLQDNPSATQGLLQDLVISGRQELAEVINQYGFYSGATTLLLTRVAFAELALQYVTTTTSTEGTTTTIPREFKNYEFYGLYHNQVCSMISQLNRYGIDGLLSPKPNSQHAAALIRQAGNTAFDFDTTYKPTTAVLNSNGYPNEKFDFNLDSPYGIYNWELFFHAPMTIAARLSQNQKFEEAQRWYHFIFDPGETDPTLPSPQRYWKFRPFFEFHDTFSIDELIKSLENRSTPFARQIAAWEKNPFQPHAIARLRIGAYMKNVVMKYLDNLIA